MGRHAKVVRKGFTLAFSGFRSSIAPTIPAINMVEKKLISSFVIYGNKTSPISVLTAKPSKMAKPPISGIIGRSFLCTSRPTIPLALIALITGGRNRQDVKKLTRKSIRAVYIGIRSASPASFKRKDDT